MTPQLTVLMSVYNGLPHLTEAIESILEQTYKEFEFLIIDDASGDGSRELLAEYAQRDSRIKVLLNEKNSGLGYSLNRGMKSATTPWVARMDADDIAVPNRLELQMDYVAEHPDTDILGGYALNINEKGEFVSERRVPTSHDEIRRLIWTNPFIHATVLLRREAILKVGSYSTQTRKRQDYQLWFRCCAAGFKFANLSVPLIKYRFTENTFKRNNFRVQIAHVLIGWRGCWMVKASPVAYVGVFVPFLIGLLPPRLSYVVYRWMKIFDPRAK